jgi:hypothetical protein
MSIQSEAINIQAEAIAVYEATLAGWTVLFNPGCDWLTDDANERHRWSVTRSNAFSGPYGCYVIENDKHVFKRHWIGPVASEVIKQAMFDMANTKVKQS